MYNHDLYILAENSYKTKNSDYETHEEISNTFYKMIDLQVISNNNFPSASVKVKKDNQIIQGNAVGSGQIDALHSSIMDVCDLEIKLLQYDIRSISKGKEALAKVKIKARYGEVEYISKSSNTDILKASTDAYLNMINSIMLDLLFPVKA